MPQSRRDFPGKTSGDGDRGFANIARNIRGPLSPPPIHSCDTTWMEIAFVRYRQPACKALVGGVGYCMSILAAPLFLPPLTPSIQSLLHDPVNLMTVPYSTSSGVM